MFQLPLSTNTAAVTVETAAALQYGLFQAVYSTKGEIMRSSSGVTGLITATFVTTFSTLHRRTLHASLSAKKGKYSIEIYLWHLLFPPSLLALRAFLSRCKIGSPSLDMTLCGSDLSGLVCPTTGSLIWFLWFLPLVINDRGQGPTLSVSDSFVLSNATYEYYDRFLVTIPLRLERDHLKCSTVTSTEIILISML